MFFVYFKKISGFIRKYLKNNLVTLIHSSSSTNFFALDNFTFSMMKTEQSIIDLKMQLHPTLFTGIIKDTDKNE